MFMTPSDLQALTGYKRPADQIRWLRTRRWIFEVGADHRPRVLRAYVERQLGGVSSTPAPPARRPQLHLS